MSDRTDTNTATDPTRAVDAAAKERAMLAIALWLETIPDERFSDDGETITLTPADIGALAPYLRALTTAAPIAPSVESMSHGCETCEVKDGHALGCVENISPDDCESALATAFCLLDTFAGEGLGHTYGNGQQIDADTTVSALCSAYGVECVPGWYRTLAAELAK